MRQVFLLSSLLFSGCLQHEDEEPPPPLPDTLETRLQYENHALKSLRLSQNSDGSWGHEAPLPITGWIHLTFLDNGETPTSKLYGDLMSRSAAYLSSEAERRLALGDSQSPLADEALLTWALSEHFAMTADHKYEDLLNRFLPRFLRRCHEKSFATESPVSLSTEFLCLKALKSLKGTGFKQALAALEAHPSKLRSHPRASISGQQLEWANLQQCDIFDSPRYKLLLERFSLPKGEVVGSDLFLQYVAYKAAFEQGGATWRSWQKWIEPRLRKMQQPDGHWASSDFAPEPMGRTWSKTDADLLNTALAAATLTVYYRFLPKSRGSDEVYPHHEANTWQETSFSSHFAADADRFSFSNGRRFLQAGELPPVDSIRLAEWLNAFPGEAPQPHPGEGLGVSLEAQPCPWQPKDLLLRVAIAAPAAKELPPLNLTLLIDTSESMADPLKLPLVKSSLHRLIAKLRPQDHLSLVTYAESAKLQLERSSDPKQQQAVLDSLQSSGGTCGSEGLRLAYDTARKGFIPNGVNRILLCSDGDFNLGLIERQDLVDLVTKEAQSGVCLSVLGFGRGILNDRICEGLADAGRGQALYIDCDAEARRVLDTELVGTLQNRVSDLRASLTFDPGQVSSWHLLGDDSRDLKSTSGTPIRDGGSLGAGQQSIALYQLRLKEKPLPGGLLKWRLNFRDETQQARVISRDWAVEPRDPSREWRQSAAVAMLVQALQRGKKEEVQALRNALPLAEGELLELVRQAQRLRRENPGTEGGEVKL
ncbi:MAG: hypothetical protein RL095_2464 [Verrucomicrobiota bacterium]